MEFWGAEVKPGQTLKVDPEMGQLIHISQAALGEVKDAKSAKNIPLRLKINDQKFVIGSLSAGERAQMLCDLVFEKEFELSHDWKHGSVYFVGYAGNELSSDEEGFDSDDDEDSGDEILEAQPNGEVKEKPVVAAKDTKVAANKAVAKKEEDYKLAKVQEDDDESDSDEEMGDEDFSSDGDLVDSDEEDDSSEEEEEELPKNLKKRAAEPSKETPPIPAKKSKASTPDKTGNKKAHVATPFPSKPGKTLAGSNNKGKDNKPTPKAAKQGKK